MGKKVKEFLAYLESHIGDAYVWGAQGERVDNRADLEKWVRRKETSRRETDRALAYIKKAAKTPLYAFDCSGLIIHWLRDIKGLIDGDTSAAGLYRQCTQKASLPRGRCSLVTLYLGTASPRAKWGTLAYTSAAAW